jgi:hypothetical protein
MNSEPEPIAAIDPISTNEEVEISAAPAPAAEAVVVEADISDFVGVAPAAAALSCEVVEEGAGVASQPSSGAPSGRKSPFSAALGVFAGVAAKVTETGRAIASAPAVASARAQATAAFAPIASRVVEGASTVAAAAGPTVLRAQSVAANAVSGVAAGAQQVAASAQRLLRGRDGATGETVDSRESAAVALPPRAYEATFNAANAASAPEAADFSIEEDDTSTTPKGVADAVIDNADDAESSSAPMSASERLAALQLRASVAANAIGGRVSAAATEVASRVRETGGAIANLPAVQQAATTAGGGIKAAAAAANRLRREVALTPAVQNAAKLP